MIRRPPRSTRTDTLFPYTTRFRSDWLDDVAVSGADMLFGFDFSAAFAFQDRGAYFPEWGDSPADMPALWALVERLAAGDLHLEAGGFLAHAQVRRHFRHGAGIAGALFEPGAGRLRLLHDRKSAVEGKRVSVRVDLGGRRINK